LPSFRRTLQRKNMMAANYRHIGGGENRLGRHYSRFSAFCPPAALAGQLLALRKLSNARSNRRNRAKHFSGGVVVWSKPSMQSTLPAIGRCRRTQSSTHPARIRLRKWRIDEGSHSPLCKRCCSGASSRRPLRPSALPAPRPRIAVWLSTCGSGGPCRANLWIGDPRDRIEHIVVHRHRERLVLLARRRS